MVKEQGILFEIPLANIFNLLKKDVILNGMYRDFQIMIVTNRIREILDNININITSNNM